MEENDEYVTELKSFNDANGNKVYVNVKRTKENVLYLSFENFNDEVLLVVKEADAKDLYLTLNSFIKKEY